MKRRTFLKGLGVALVAPKTLLTGEVKAAVPVSNYKPLPAGMTIRTGLPEVTWRKLHEGISPLARNEILDDLTWKKL